MEGAGEATAAVFEATVFIDYFKEMPDPRQPGKVAYRLDEVLLLALLGVLAGGEGFTDVARFGQKKLALLRRFLPFANGTPSIPARGQRMGDTSPSRALGQQSAATKGSLSENDRAAHDREARSHEQGGHRHCRRHLGGRAVARRGSCPHRAIPRSDQKEGS